MYGHHPFYRPISRPRFPPWGLRVPLFHPYHRPFLPHLIPPRYFAFGHFRDANNGQLRNDNVDQSDGMLPNQLAPGVDLVEDAVVAVGQVGRGDAAQLHPQAAAADSEAGAQPRPVPTRRRMQGHLQVSLRALHFGKFKGTRQTNVLCLLVQFFKGVLEQSGNTRNGHEKTFG